MEFNHVKSRKQVDPQAMEDDAFYSTPQWRLLRTQKLTQDPFCECPEHAGKQYLTNRMEVDHKTQISAGGSKLDINNLQTLAKPCHDRKRQLESTTRRLLRKLGS